VVTNHIISDPWYESVFLMADKVDNMATKNFTVQVGGGFDSVGGGCFNKEGLLLIIVKVIELNEGDCSLNI
jgi:hypothetical protein